MATKEKATSTKDKATATTATASKTTTTVKVEAPKLDAKMKKILANKDTGKSEKVRLFMDLGVTSPKFMADNINMHYSHCVTVKRAYIAKQAAPKATAS